MFPLDSILSLYSLSEEPCQAGSITGNVDLVSLDLEVPNRNPTLDAHHKPTGYVSRGTYVTTGVSRLPE